MDLKNNTVYPVSKLPYIFGSKSNTLKFLQKKIKKSKIEPIYDFTVNKWQKNEKIILKIILIIIYKWSKN